MSRRRPASAHRPASSLARLAPAALAAGLLLTGCSATNPMLTQLDYDASDGLAVELGDVRGINILVVASAEGEPGVLVGALTNESDEDTTVELTLTGEEGAAGDPVSVDLPAFGTVSFGGAESTEGRVQAEDVEFEQVPARPGAFVELQVRIDTGETATRRVPVLDGTIPPYDELLPSGS